MLKLFPVALALTFPLSCCPDEPQTGASGWGEACSVDDDCDHALGCFRGYCAELCSAVPPAGGVGESDPDAGDCSPVYSKDNQQVPQYCNRTCAFRCDNGLSCPVIPEFEVSLVCGYDGIFCEAE